MTRRAAASEEVQNDGVRVVPGRSEQAIVDSPKALREGKRRSGNQFANKAGSIVVGVIPLVVPNGSIEAKGFPKFDLVAIARLLGAQHRSNSLDRLPRSEEHTSELQSLMRISYAVFCLKKKTN